MPVNNIAFLPFQGESGAEPFLSSYAKSQQIAQSREAAERQKVLAQRQDQTYGQDQRMKAIDQLGAMLDGVQDEGGFEQVKGWAVQNGLLDPNEAQRYTFDTLPQIRALSQQARQLAAQRAAAQQQQQEFGLKSRLTEAQIASARAQANAANALAGQRAAGGGGSQGNAPQGYQWVRGEDGSMSLAPVKGGPADPNRIAPGEGVKVRASNAQLDALEQSLNNYLTDLGKTTPVGRLVTRGPEVSRVETGHTDLLMQMKNLYELGVLNGPDYMLMTKIVEDPTGFSQIARGTEGLKAQADTVRSIIARSRNINNAKLGMPPAGPPQQGGDYRQEQRQLLQSPQPAQGAVIRYDAQGNRVQ